MSGKLILNEGTIIEGESFGADVSTSGEVVFNTGMAGYPETLTDPSYYGQILVCTYPIIGSYGVPDKKFWESSKIQIKALIVQNYIDTPSHFESQKTLSQWLKEEGIPAIQGVDTRALTTKLRAHGVMLGKIAISHQPSAISQYDPNSENVLPFVSTSSVQTYGEGKKNIVLIDCGAKENIVRSLVKRGIRVTRVPWNWGSESNPLSLRSHPELVSGSSRVGDSHEVRGFRNESGMTLKSGNFDGVLISNGPGDPKKAIETIQTVKKLISQNIPTLGICLGNQILALAAGADTYKLKFGHRGQNQPVQNLQTKKCLVTSQNHGFAVDPKKLPSDWVESFINLNDGTNEGIRHKTKPFLSAQFHPEASPGPVEAKEIFDEFLNLIK